MPTVHWFRRDLRLTDHPSLAAAAEGATDGTVVPLVVIDPVLWDASGDVRRAYFVRSVEALRDSLDGRLLVRHGEPEAVVSSVARECAATTVHVSADFGRYGQARDRRVEAALAAQGIGWQATGSPYAVAPGRVTKGDGTAYRVYTPYYKAWLAHGWRSPAADAVATWTVPLDTEPLPPAPDLGDLRLPAAGEDAALARWDAFRQGALEGYGDDRNRPDIGGTSGLSAALRWGEVHPRTLLADLDDSPGAEVFRKELAWREFYADVMWRNPQSVHAPLDARFAAMRHDSGRAAEERLAAWQAGRTGYPFVDAGMRQLLAEGWMHNRVRMVVASFLVKDLHLPWWWGARWFMRWLRDGDTASNVQGWQWTAGCGTDAAPYFRVFNPVTQGLRFDPDGDYVRRYVPELAHLDGATAHEPWDHPGGEARGYPARIVDHGEERDEALRRLAELPARDAG